MILSKPVNIKRTLYDFANADFPCCIHKIKKTQILKNGC